MAFLMVHQNVDQRESVWHIDSTAGLAAAQVWPARAVKLEWEDGTLETIPARTRALFGGVSAVDLTSLDYYLVVGQGDPTTLVLAAITDIATFDTLIVAQPWGILRVLGKWGSNRYWTASSS